MCNLRDREKHSAFTGYRGEENLFRNRDGLPQKMLCIFSQDDLGKKKKKTLAEKYMKYPFWACKNNLFSYIVLLITISFQLNRTPT